MAVTPLPHPTSRDLVANARGLMEGLASTDWAALEDTELVTVVEEIQALHAITRAVELMAVAEIDDRDVAREQLGWGSTADWYTHLAGVRRGQGRRTVDHAVQLTNGRPATLDALVSGAVSPEHVDVVLDAVDRLPAIASLRDDVEQALLDRATHLTATDLQRAVRHVIDVADPDHHQRDLEKLLDREDRVAHHRRMLSISDDGSGGVRIKGRGTLEDGAVLRAALLPLTAPTPTIDPQTCEQMPDPRDFGVRMWDALVGVAQHSLDTDLAPEAHCAQPRVAVTMDFGTLRGELAGRGLTDDGLELAPSTVRRMACDADVVPVVLGKGGVVLDLGRTHRLVTAPLWRALVTRDRHCAFPGCTRPPVMSHAHHIVHWANGGVTSLSNLVLLCGHHHRTIHNTPWEVRLSTDDGLPEFRPPPKPGRTDEWQRNRPRRE